MTFGLAYSPLNSAKLSCSSEVTLRNKYDQSISQKNNFEKKKSTLFKIKIVVSLSEVKCVTLINLSVSFLLFWFLPWHSFALKKNKKSIRDGERRRPRDGYRTGFLPVLPALVCRAKSVAYPHCHISIVKCLTQQKIFSLTLFV